MTVNDLEMKMVLPNSDYEVKYVDTDGREFDRPFSMVGYLVHSFYLRHDSIIIVCYKK